MSCVIFTGRFFETTILSLTKILFLIKKLFDIAIVFIPPDKVDF